MAAFSAALGALVLLTPCHAMIWTPKNPRNFMWDTWLYAQPGQDSVPKYYMNYLSSCDSCGGPPGGSWNGVGATTSEDGVHYEDQGIVIQKDKNAVWLGSGSVLKNADGEYVMNFSEEYDCQPSKPNATYGTGGCQSIFFATSKDLRNWTRLAFKPPPANDTEVFKYSDGGLGGTTPGYTIGGRWDCIATVPVPNKHGYFYGYWTASPSGHGGAGVGETTDLTGHHWKALPPVTDGYPNGEVGSTVVLGGKYYMLFGGGHIYSSDDPIKGYKPDPVNWAFHTDGQGVYFSRLWNVQRGSSSTNTSTGSNGVGAAGEEQVLLSHQWVTGGTHGKGIYLGPLKELKIGADGTPRATYWAGNEKLKGDVITLPPLPPPTPPAPPPPPMVVVDVSGCGGSNEQWKLPSVGGAAAQIALNATACLAVDGGAGTEDSIVLSSCGAAATLFAVKQNGSIIGHGGRCMDALPPLHMAECDAASISQQWSTAGGTIRLAMHAAAATTDQQQRLPLAPLDPTNLWQFEEPSDSLLGVNTGSAGNPPLTCTGKCTRATAGAGHSGGGWSTTGGSYLGNGDKSVPAGVPLGNDAYTVCAWIKPTGHACQGGMGGVVGWGDWSSINGSNGFATSGKGDTFWNYWFSTAAGGGEVDMEFAAPGLCSSKGTWGHVLCKWDPTTITKSCYWNGQLAKTQKLPGGHGAKDGFFRIGNTHQNEFYVGVMDDVAIFDSALPDAAIPQAMLGDFKSNHSGLCVRASEIPVPPPKHEPGKVFDTAVDLTIGVVIEATLTCANSTTAGLLVRGTGTEATFVWDCASQTFHLPGGLTIDRNTSFPQGQPIELKMLLRSTPDGETGMAEFYANGVMSHPYTFKLGGGASARIGVIDTTAPSTVASVASPVQAVKAWKMTLKAE